MNRQQALNQLRLMQAWHEDFGNGPCPDYDAICYAINIIEEMPEGMDALIKALEQEHKKLLEMQKAQPEIIRCKDCKYAHITYGGEVKYCDIWFSNESHYIDTDNYCSFAERRTDG